MEIKINKQILDLDTNEIKGNIDFMIDLKKLEGYDYGRREDHVYNKILKLVSDRISNEFLEKYSEKIISEIDVNEIIKRVKLNIIQNVARS